MRDKPRILCWVLTSPENVQKRAVHVRDTWGQRCDKLLFFSSQENHQLPTIPLHVPEGWESIWLKTKAAFYYVYEHHMEDADWFLKADDDTYVILENLRYLLFRESPLRAVYFGRRFKPDIAQGYMSGGAGYVLSAEALRRLATGLFNESICRQGGLANEDIELGRCMEKLGVEAGNSRDQLQRETFFPFNPQFHVTSRKAKAKHKDFWFWNDWTYYQLVEGTEGMSNKAVSFHYVKPSQMYLLDYLLYKVTLSCNHVNNTMAIRPPS